MEEPPCYFITLFQFLQSLCRYISVGLWYSGIKKLCTRRPHHRLWAPQNTSQNILRCFSNFHRESLSKNKKKKSEDIFKEQVFSFKSRLETEISRTKPKAPQLTLEGANSDEDVWLPSPTWFALLYYLPFLLETRALISHNGFRWEECGS